MMSMKAVGPPNDLQPRRWTGTLCSRRARQSEPARSTMIRGDARSGRIALESSMLIVRASLSVRRWHGPVIWTRDLDRLLRSSCVICALQCMRSVHWSTQATAAALVQRQMAMKPLWRRSNAEEGHGHRNAADTETARAVKKPSRRALSYLLALRGSTDLLRT